MATQKQRKKIARMFKEDEYWEIRRSYVEHRKMERRKEAEKFRKITENPFKEKR